MDDLTTVNVAATYLGFRWIDKFGRRKLAIGGYIGMIISALVAALGLGLLSGTARERNRRLDGLLDVRR